MSDVLGVVEHRRGELRPVSFELLSAGADLADSLDGTFHVAVIGGTAEAFADRLDREGVDVIHTVENGAEFNHDVVVETVVALCEQLSPGVVLAPHTVNALDYVPAVAVDQACPLVTDVTAIEVPEEDGQLVATRGYYESKMTAPVTVADGPAAVTIRPGEWPVAEGIGEAERRVFEFSVDEATLGSTVEGYEEAGAADVDVTAAGRSVTVTGAVIFDS